jgi:hypothetical protein
VKNIENVVELYPITKLLHSKENNQPNETADYELGDNIYKSCVFEDVTMESV